jgi:hypothetical protein
MGNVHDISTRKLKPLEDDWCRWEKRMKMVVRKILCEVGTSFWLR